MALSLVALIKLSMVSSRELRYGLGIPIDFLAKHRGEYSSPDESGEGKVSRHTSHLEVPTCREKEPTKESAQCRTSIYSKMNLWIRCYWKYYKKANSYSSKTLTLQHLISRYNTIIRLYQKSKKSL
jgi:hypothetical protein